MKKKKKAQHGNILILLTEKGEDVDVSLVFRLPLSFPHTVSIYLLCLLPVCVCVCGFFPKDTEGHGAPLPARDLVGRSSHVKKNKIVCGGVGKKMPRCHLTSTPV